MAKRKGRKWRQRNAGIVDVETGIWDLEIATTQHYLDEPLALKIISMYSPLTTADVGCGQGMYCKFFRDHGWPVVHGYEGTPNVKSFGVYDNITIIDLSKKQQIETFYDFVLCTEVGEHIPKKHEQTFIDNLCKFVNKDLVMSWAIPGQRGRGHFNEQSNKYIISEFKRRELIYDVDSTRILRKAGTVKYWKNTIMVFKKRSIF